MMKPLQSPFSWFGSKRRIARAIWQRLGNTRNYVEPFAGSLAVLIARPHAPQIETCNDADALLCNFWRATQADPVAVAEHADWPVSECDLHSRHLWLVNEGRRRAEHMKVDPDFYDTQVAGWWLYGIAQWIGTGWCSGEGPHKLPGQEQGVKHKSPQSKKAESGIICEAGKLAQGVRQLPKVSKNDGNVGGAAGTGGVRNLVPDTSSSGRSINKVPQQVPLLSVAGQCINRKLPSISDGGQGVHKKVPTLSSPGRGIHARVAQITGQGACEQRLAYLLDLMQALSDRLRNVRIVCGDWTRVLTPSVTTHNGLTACLLDPPYLPGEHCGGMYRDEGEIAWDVRKWALENGDNPELRIALCGYPAPGYTMPRSWKVLTWKNNGGYGNQAVDGQGRENSKRETIWFSPHCINPSASLFDDAEDEEMEGDVVILDEEEVLEDPEPEAPVVPTIPWYQRLAQSAKETE